MNNNGIQDSDESLMVRVSSGDHQAFSILVRRHTQRFYAAAYRLCGHADEAEDIVQEAFLKLWRKPEMWKIEKGVKFTTWFYRVVNNQALDQIRKRRPESGVDTLEHFADSRAAQDSALHEAREAKALEEAIQSLPDRQKQALNLCVYEDMSNREAAQVMGIGIKALESLLMRAKAGLKDELVRRGLMSKNGKEQRYG